MKRNILAIAISAVAVLGALWLVHDVRRGAEAGSPPATETGADAMPLLTSAPTQKPDRAQELLDGMTLEEKVWQMLYVFPQHVCGENTCADEAVWREALQKYPAGGFVLNSDNMSSPEQLRATVRCIKAGSAITPFVGVDEEGGSVARLAYTLGVTTDFKPMFTYRELGADGAFANAQIIAGDAASFGFNQDFAPVADVWTNAENTVIGKRAYSSDPEEAAELVAAAVRGFTSGGVIATLKHFPGHGDTQEDSHYAAAHSAKTLDELRGCEMLPFESGIAAGAGMVMTGHITMDAIDPDVPATLSGKIVTELLRGELGWDGVVITDSFTMAAIAERYDPARAAVMAIEAGCDIILGAADPQSAAAAIAESVSPERIDESVLRILRLKLGSGVIE